MNNEFIKIYQTRVNNALEKILPPVTQLPQRLHEAMRYSVLNGGKRIRPALVYATGALVNGKSEFLDAAACAVELIHSYSLVHDDLPAMDNDTLRRGKPTCHIAFGEATAILVGDALQSLAFQCLAKTKLEFVEILAQAAGSLGMVAGQQIDIENTGKIIDLSMLQQMHAFKTGALIKASILMGAQSADHVRDIQFFALSTYADNLGLSFQVQDDILDIESSTENLGKTQGKDLTQSKNTYPSILGLEPAKKYAHELYQQAIDAISIFDERADHLRSLAKYAVYRNN